MMIFITLSVLVGALYEVSLRRYSSRYVPSIQTNLPGIFSVYLTDVDMDLLTKPLRFNGFEVPAQYYTDMTTTYWFIRWFIPRYSKANIASVIHDYHYTHGGVKNRAAADEQFRIHLIMTGMSPAKARLYWIGVRVGGYKGWNNYRKQKVNMSAMGEVNHLISSFKDLAMVTGNNLLRTV